MTANIWHEQPIEDSEVDVEVVVEKQTLIPVAFALNEVVADVLRDALSCAGIDWVTGEQAGIDVVALGKVPILVSQSNYERACEILANADSTKDDDDWNNDDKDELEEFEDDDDHDDLLDNEDDEFDDQDDDDDDDFDE